MIQGKSHHAESRAKTRNPAPPRLGFKEKRHRDCCTASASPLHLRSTATVQPRSRNCARKAPAAAYWLLHKFPQASEGIR